MAALSALVEFTAFSESAGLATGFAAVVFFCAGGTGVGKFTSWMAPVGQTATHLRHNLQRLKSI